MYEDEFEKVGYIPHELTQYLHPLLKTHSLEFSVKNIRFQTVYLCVGFYLTINVTKDGLWPDEVVVASKKVK